jgi:O-antigen ligase
MFASVLRRFSFFGWLRYWLFDRYYNTTLRVSLIGICFGFSALTAILIRDIDFGSFNSIVKAVLLIALMGGLTLAIFMYRNMQVTALAIFMLSTLVNEGINTGTGTKLTFTFLSLIMWSGVWLFKKFVVDRDFNVRRALPNWPIALFIIVVIISYVWSGTFVEERASFMFAQKSLVRLMTAIVLIVSPLTLVLFANAFRSRRAFKLFTFWFITLGLIMAVLRLTTGTIFPPLNAKGQFPTWFTALALGQALFNKNLSWYVRIAMLVGCGLWAQITLGLGLTWLSGWLPVVLVIGVLLTFYSRKLLVIALLGVALWGVTNTSFIDKTFGAEQSESGGTRSTAWARSLGVVANHFLFGAGPAGYEYYFHAYGYYNGPTGTADLSHNNYIDIIAQTGVVGFTLWLAMWAGQGWMMWKLFRKRFDDPFLIALKYSLIACYPAILAAMMLGDWITPFPYTQSLAGIDYTIWAWMISGISIALYYFTPNVEEGKKLQSSAPHPELSVNNLA